MATFAITIETDSLFSLPNEYELPKACQTYSTDCGPPGAAGHSNHLF